MYVFNWLDLNNYFYFYDKKERVTFYYYCKFKNKIYINVNQQFFVQCFIFFVWIIFIVDFLCYRFFEYWSFRDVDQLKLDMVFDW